MRVLRTVLQGFQNNMGWSVTELSAGDVAIFNGYNGVLYIVALQIVNDDLAVGAKLGCKTASKACIKINCCFVHGFLLSKSKSVHHTICLMLYLS